MTYIAVLYAMQTGYSTSSYKHKKKIPLHILRNPYSNEPFQSF